MSKKLTGKLDRMMSNLVREAADYTCQLRLDERCLFQARGRQMHWCHWIGRLNRSTRWNPEAAICGCSACHRRLDLFPLEKAYLFRKHVGDTRAEEIERLGHTVRKWTNAEKEDMLKHYRQELERVRHERNRGKVGVIQITPYE